MKQTSLLLGDEVPIVVDDRVRIDRRYLSEDARIGLQVAFTHENPEWRKRRAARVPVGGETRQIATWLDEGGELSFPRGGMERVRRVLHEHRLAWSVDDQRIEGSEDLISAHGPIPDDLVGLRPYQVEAIDALLATENAILRAATGVGKTTIILAAIARLKLPALVVVPDVGLLDLWVARATRELGLRPDQIGQIGDGRWSIRPLTIATDDTLHARGVDELRDLFGVVAYDEVHGAAARTVYKVLDAFPARYRIGASTDETRHDKKEFLVHDLFGQAAYSISYDDAVAQGHILEVEIRVVPTEFDAPWYRSAFVEASRSRNRAKLMGIHAQFLDEVTADEERNDLILDWVRREGQTASAVLSHRVEHATSLERRISGTGLRTGLLLGSAEYKRRFRETVAGLTNGDLRVGVGTVQAFGVGKDVPAIANVFLVTPIGNNRQLFAQVKGRACRLGKDSARLFYFWDRRCQGKKTIENLLKWNRVVSVWDGQDWVPGKSYLRGLRASPAGRRESE